MLRLIAIAVAATIGSRGIECGQAAQATLA